MPRDVSGNYTLPAGINPVVSNTVIDVDWANPTLSDIATQLNNVLTRDGLLGPVVAFKIQDGTSALPGLSFASQANTGLYRDATQMGLSYSGTSIATLNAAGVALAAGKQLTLPTAPVVGTDAANKAYVDSAVGGGGGGGGVAAKASTLAQGGGNGPAMTFAYSEPGGAPLKVWGTNDGVTSWAFTFSSLSIGNANYATKAGQLASGGGSAGSPMIFTASALASTPDVVWGSSSGNTLNNGYNTATLAVGTAATVRNAAQPIITSLGSLTGLTVSGITSLDSYASYIGIELGWRSSPRLALSNQVLPSSVRGCTVVMTGNNTINTGTFNEGDFFWVVNGGSGDVRILAGAGMTIHNGGTLSTNNISLLPWGGARIWFLSSVEAIMSGNTN